MTKFANLSWWLSSVACGVCLVLAVLATPGVARADPPCACCGEDPGIGDPQGHLVWQNCMNDCTANNGNCRPNAFFCDFIFSYCVQPNCKTQICVCEGAGVLCAPKPGSTTDCYCVFGG